MGFFVLLIFFITFGVIVLLCVYFLFYLIMSKEFFKFFLILSFVIYLITSYVFANFNPFDVPVVVRLIQVFLLMGIMYVVKDEML